LQQYLPIGDIIRLVLELGSSLDGNQSPPHHRRAQGAFHHTRNGIVKTKRVSAGVDVTAILPPCA
jgi:hypothetical protein